MKSKSKKSGGRDPLAEELDFEKLEIVAYGPGWKKTAPSRGSKHLRVVRAKATRKPTSSKSSRRAA